MVTEIAQQVVNGLTMGSIYALVALGITMIFAAMGILNFAHADVLMVGTFLCRTMCVEWGVPFLAAMIISLVAAYCLGVLTERAVFRPMGEASFLAMLLATIGVSTILRNLAILVWGAETRQFPSFFSSVPVNFGGLIIVPRNLWTIAVSLTVMIALRLFFTRTKMGKAMRAANDDRYACGLMGIEVNHTTALTFGISAVLGTIAGILLSPIMFVSFMMAPVICLKAFACAVVGGLGNFYGAIIGGIALGVVETFAARYVSSAYRDAIAYGILIMFLLVRPTGLFGKKGVEKV